MKVHIFSIDKDNDLDELVANVKYISVASGRVFCDIKSGSLYEQTWNPNKTVCVEIMEGDLFQ